MKKKIVHKNTYIIQTDVRLRLVSRCVGRVEIMPTPMLGGDAMAALEPTWVRGLVAKLPKILAYFHFFQIYLFIYLFCEHMTFFTFSVYKIADGLLLKLGRLDTRILRTNIFKNV